MQQDRPIIIGAGLAGLMTALHLAPMPVLVLAGAPLGSGAASAWAQGGVAACVGVDDDPAGHLADTLAAGDGLCDAGVAARILRAGPDSIATLARHGVEFDRTADGRLALGLEAAHSRRRIVHAGGDGTGAEIMRALIAAVQRTPSITVLERTEARRLVVEDNRVRGVLVAAPHGPLLLPASRIVLASGGIGGLFLHTTNPPSSWGQGLLLAARAGAALADLEFMQFHPTALAAGTDPLPLVSEAVRGEGAILIDEDGTRFLAESPGAELGPRDVVARGIFRHLAAGHLVFLDARAALGAGFASRFPTIAAACHTSGIDPATQPIPVVPAAHFHMGGVAVDAAGRSSVAGLWACGETASTGLHGANRLASNSLLEAATCASWVAGDVAATPPARLRLLAERRLPPAPDVAPVRPVLSRHVGLLRDGEGLLAAIRALAPLAAMGGAAADPATLGLMLAVAALRREESRGAHARSDFPARSAGFSTRLTLHLADATEAAAQLADPIVRRA
jgi:L-aspartate oxidase